MRTCIYVIYIKTFVLVNICISCPINFINFVFSYMPIFHIDVLQNSLFFSSSRYIRIDVLYTSLIFTSWMYVNINVLYTSFGI